MRSTYLIFGSLVALFTVSLSQFVSHAEEIDARNPAILEAAQEGFKTLLEVTRGKDFEGIFDVFGFDSPAQATNLKLGAPLIMRWIRFDRLKAFDGATLDPENLLESTFQVLFPILSQDEVVTSLTVTFFPKRKMWKITGWGDKQVIRGLAHLDQYQKSKTSFVIWVPALQIHFLADQIAGQLALFPIRDYPRFNLEAGQSLQAREVFSHMQQVVAKYSGEVRPQ